VETTLEGGGESADSNYVEHPMDDTDSPPIRRTDEGRIYGRLPTTYRGPRTKHMASKHTCPKYCLTEAHTTGPQTAGQACVTNQNHKKTQRAGQVPSESLTEIMNNDVSRLRHD